MGAGASGNEVTPSFTEALEKASAAPAEEQLSVLLEGISEEERASLKMALVGLSAGAISHLPKPKVAAAEASNQEEAAEAPAAEAPAAAPEEEGGLTEAQVANVRAAFDAIDADKSGTIEVKELAQVMKALDVTLTDDEVSAVFGKLDIDGNGKLDFDEYLKMVKAALAK